MKTLASKILKNARVILFIVVLAMFAIAASAPEIIGTAR
jgi:hypothetical protein